MKIDISFAPAWWLAHYGMDSGAALWADPIARTERDCQQRRLLFERFGDVGLGEEHPKPHPSIEAYGHRFMAALWGCAIKYQPDQAPAAEVLPDAHKRMQNIQSPDLQASPIVQRAFEEAQLLKQRYGWCDGSINVGGPLNNAVSVFGEEILAACAHRQYSAAEPELAQHVLQKMAETVLAVDEQITCRINDTDTALPRPWFGIGNCPVCLIAPQTYRQVVLPVDQWLRGHFQELHLHHCGIFHPYVQAYHDLHPTHIDVGWGTDLRATRRAYPQTPMSLEIQVKALNNKSQAEIDAMIARMVEDAGPPELITVLWAAEAGPDLPDQTVRDLMTAPVRLRWL